MSALLDVRDVDVAIGATRVCRGLRLRIDPGQCWALLGRNGAGKTTLLHRLAGLTSGGRGRVTLGGDDIASLQPRRRARRVAVLLQHSDRGFGASVLETVLSGRHPHLGRFAWEGADDLAIAERCIADTGLGALTGRALTTLSGGELRRVEIARLLAQSCPLNLLDEPLNHLDFGHQAAILRLLRERCVDRSHALLMVVHDLNIALRHCDHWLLLAGDGRWHAGRRDDLAAPELLSAAFGHPVMRIDTPAGAMLQPRL
ncbi:MAG: ABC transporter ATP-binding protein [Gammaproteobacteria bacterium]|nr:ABC transporter ATP-binding protein [Gammaproteobacteria bacterium]